MNYSYVQQLINDRLHVAKSYTYMSSYELVDYQYDIMEDQEDIKLLQDTYRGELTKNMQKDLLEAWYILKDCEYRLINTKF